MPAAVLSKRFVLLAALGVIVVLAVAACRPAQYSLSVSASPGDGGSVSPGGGSYARGAEVTLTATPSRYYRFDGWSGDASGSATRLTVKMDSNKKVVASFSRPSYNFLGRVSDPSGGRVEPRSGTYPAGTQVTVTAIAARGYRFDHWEGAASGTSSSTSVVLDADRTATAYFAKVYTLSLTADPAEGGSIKPASGTYDAGARVSLTVTAAFPYAFSYWTGTDTDNGKSLTSTVTMSSDRSATAHFTRLKPGVEQRKSGHYLGWEIRIPIALTTGQWVKGSMTSSPSPMSVRVEDGKSNVVQDFGQTSNLSYTFQANSDGTYNIVIQSSSGTASSTSYTVSYTVYYLGDQLEQLTPTKSYSDDFSRDSGLWTYAGSAHRDAADKSLVLTDGPNQTGLAWFSYGTKGPFALKFQYSTAAADGFVLMFYKTKDYQASGGSYLGFWGPPRPAPGYGIEFDMAQSPGQGDPNSSHIALIQGSTDNHLAYALAAIPGIHSVQVLVGQDAISVEVDGAIVVSWRGAIDRSYDGLAFAGATGDQASRQAIRDVQLQFLQ